MDRLREFGDRVAIIHQNGSLSYRQLDLLIDLLRDKLDVIGLRPGDRVAARLANSLELLVCYYACLRSGFVIVPVHERLSIREVVEILDHCQPSCLIEAGTDSEESDLPEAHRHLPRIRLNRIDNWLRDAELKHVRQCPTFPTDHPAIIFYTSGSTGRPKGIVYSHGTLAGNSRVYASGLTVTAEDHVVLCHCLTSNFVFAQLTFPFLELGARVQVVDFGNVEQTLGAIESGATFLSLVPWFGFQLIEAGRRRPHASNQLRSCEVGGDRVPLAYFDEFKEVFGVHPREHLGMAETNTFVVNPPSEEDMRPGSAGVPLPEVEIEIRGPDRRPLPTGVDGEIWVQTPGAMHGYWRDDAATDGVMVDGWVATGDIGQLDADGFLWFTGRIRQFIVSDGDNVYPREIEREVERHPIVRQACVVGLPHATRGETVAAALVLSDPEAQLTEAELLAFVRGRLSSTKTPGSIRIMDRFPETSAGKIDREAIVKVLLNDKRPRTHP